MSNQRPGKKQSKPDMFGQEMAVQKILTNENKVDEAFMAEMMVDWLQSGKRLPNTEEDVIKALGI